MSTATHIIITERKTSGHGYETRTFATTSTPEKLAENYRNWLKRWIAETGYHGEKDSFRIVAGYTVASALDTKPLEGSIGRAIGMQLAEERGPTNTVVATPFAEPAEADQADTAGEADDEAAAVEEAADDEDADVKKKAVLSSATKVAWLEEMADVLEGKRRWSKNLSFEAVTWALLDADPKEDARGMAHVLEFLPYSTFGEDYAVGRYLCSLDGGMQLAQKLGHAPAPLLVSALAALGAVATGKDIARGFLAQLFRAEIARLSGTAVPSSAA